MDRNDSAEDEHGATVPGAPGTGRRPRSSRVRQVAAGALLVGVGVLVGAGAVAFGLRPASTTPSPAPSDTGIPFGAMFVVWQNGTWANQDLCVVPTMTYGRAQPDYGEEYLDGGGVVINFTGRIADHVTELRAAVPDFCRVYVRKVTLGSAKGRALQKAIRMDQQALSAAGIPITTIGYDPISDRVGIGVYTLTPEARAELERRYGKDRIDVVQARPEPA